MPTTKVTAAQFKQILVMRRTEVAQEKQRAEAARVSATKIAMDEKVAIVHMHMHRRTQTHSHTFTKTTASQKLTILAYCTYAAAENYKHNCERSVVNTAVARQSIHAASVRDSRQRTFLHAPPSPSPPRSNECLSHRLITAGS